MKLRSIQVLRGIAASGVVLLHANSFGTHGAAGVDLFFVISGFIMTTIPKRPSFLFDRFWRIFPLWWIALALWLAFNPATHVLASIALWPISNGEMTEPALSVGWTLSFEILFYCAVAWAARFGAKAPIILFGLALAVSLRFHNPVSSYIGNPIIFEFLFGVAIAKLPKNARLALPLLILAIIWFALSPAWVYPPAFAMRAPASAWRVLYWGAPAALIVYACLSIEGMFRSRAWNLAVLLGDASYSIYLFHLIVTSNVPLPGPVKAALAIGFGLVIWWLLERRILALKPALSGLHEHDIAAVGVTARRPIDR